MLRNFKKFSEKQYDILIVGGGINGAAIANLAQDHGLSAALLEKRDFASGTSGRSTKLVHGGIRYLENFDLELVFESLKERAIQLEAAPHLVKPLPFIIPVYRGDRRPLWMMRTGVFLYDGLARKRVIQKHRSLKACDVQKLIPGIKKEGLKGGVLYFDAQMDDARLCLENVLSSVQKGADALNYVEVISFLKQDGKVIGVQARDVLGTDIFNLKAKKIVCAVGPWTNRVLRMDQGHAKKKVRTTKGVHIVYQGRFSDHALLLPSDKDGRVFFVIPWMDNTLIGTTDTDYIGDPDDVNTSPQDIDYLLEGARRVFPDHDVSLRGVISTFAGLRPLIRKGGSAYRVSRKHAFIETGSGIVFVIGGKYTTYRKIAEDCLKRIFNIKADKPFRLYGSGKIDEEASAVSLEYSLDIRIVRHLMSKYGIRYKDVLCMVKQSRELGRKICSCGPAIKAELYYSRDRELACTPDDIISRRLGIDNLPCKTRECVSAIKNFFEEYE